MARRKRGGFIFLFGSRNLIGKDSTPPIEATCPNCRQQATIVGKTARQWFTLFFIPVFPMGRKQRFTQCSNCKAQFRLPVEQMSRRLSNNQQGDHQRAITLYNSLRASPANSITLNELMQMYGQMSEYDQAISAARDFPQALQNSEQCMCTLGRILLAAGRNDEAIGWFDAALQRNGQFGEAFFHKALACLGCHPPKTDEAIAAARAARNNGFPNAEQLLRQIEAKARI
jgi:tetratricopeptide (TPR) repeat protein